MDLPHLMIDGRKTEGSQDESPGIQRNDPALLEKKWAVMPSIGIAQGSVELKLSIEGSDELVRLGRPEHSPVDLGEKKPSRILSVVGFEGDRGVEGRC